MADTQYFKTETWTETSTGPNKCPNQDLDCVCFNGQDRDCPRPSLVSSPVACTGTRTATRPDPRPHVGMGCAGSESELSRKLERLRYCWFVDWRLTNETCGLSWLWSNHIRNNCFLLDRGQSAYVVCSMYIPVLRISQSTDTDSRPELRKSLSPVPIR